MELEFQEKSELEREAVRREDALEMRDRELKRTQQRIEADERDLEEQKRALARERQTLMDSEHEATSYVAPIGSS